LAVMGHDIKQQQLTEGSPRRLLRLGSRLLENAYAQDGTLLLRVGARIQTLSELERLRRPDVRFGEHRAAEIPFDMDNEAALDETDAQPDPRAAEFAKKIEKATGLKQEAVADVEWVFTAADAGEAVDLKLARRTVAALLTDLLDDPRALVSLAELKDADAYTYTHSVNVSILGMHLALHTEHRKDIEDIGVGALLHDIGKAQMPARILNKQGPLDSAEMQEMKRHPEIGLQRLKQSGETRPVVLSCVLSHHEKVSGKGYPQGRRGRHICPYAMVISIADIYDALTTDRPYRSAMDPKEALLLMARKMREDLHDGLLQCFVSIVGYYPVGSEVELSNGFKGRVLKHYASRPNEPTIVLVSDDDDRPIPGSHVVDLAGERGVSILRFVEGNKGFCVARGLVDETDKAA